MLFETNILELLKFLPSRRLLQEKRRTRELLTQKRRLMTKDQVEQESDKLLAHLELLPAFQAAKTVMIYYPTHNEVDVLSLIKKHKHEKIFLFPVVHRSSMQACPYEGNAKMHRGKFNIPEPTTAPYQGNIDLIVVPGVGFDKHGNRLGRGGGYYDIFLANLRRNTILVGVGYDFQVVDKVPTNRRDKKMDYIISPSSGCIKTKRD